MRLNRREKRRKKKKVIEREGDGDSSVRNERTYHVSLFTCVYYVRSYNTHVLHRSWGYTTLSSTIAVSPNSNARVSHFDARGKKQLRIIEVGGARHAWCECGVSQVDEMGWTDRDDMAFVPSIDTRHGRDRTGQVVSGHRLTSHTGATRRATSSHSQSNGRHTHAYEDSRKERKSKKSKSNTKGQQVEAGGGRGSQYAMQDDCPTALIRSGHARRRRWHFSRRICGYRYVGVGV